MVQEGIGIYPPRGAGTQSAYPCILVAKMIDTVLRPRQNLRIEAYERTGPLGMPR